MVKTEQAIAIGAIAVGIPLFYLAIIPPGIKSTGGKVTVTIDVVDQHTGEPIVGAAIGLNASTFYTDLSGNAVIQGWATGPYYLSVSALGYKSVNETVVVSSTDYSFEVQLPPSVVCVPPTCACNQVYNAATCGCVPRAVGSVQVEASQTIAQAWYMYMGCNSNRLLSTGLFPGNPSSCPMFWAPPAHPSNSLLVAQSGRVLGTDGNPLCDTTVAISMQEFVPWSANGVGGKLDFIYPGTVQTDSSGNFSYDIQLEFNPVDYDINIETCTLIGAGGPTVVQNTITYTIPGTTAQAGTSFVVEMLVCAGYNLVE